MKKILFVCLGNICRSPSAEGVFLAELKKRHLCDNYFVDSAGTGAWHVGELADSRMRKHALIRGYDLVSRARQVKVTDFDEFDVIIAMDKSNLNNLKKLRESSSGGAKCFLMTDFSREFQGTEEVPDPYYGGEEGFERVLDLLEDACKELLDKLETNEV